MGEKFLYLKLGFGNCLADYWLGNSGKDNVLKQTAAAILFWRITADEYSNLIGMKYEEKECERLCKDYKIERDKANPIKRRLGQIEEFFNARKNGKKFVATTSSRVYIYEPDGPVKTLDDEKLQGEYDKDIDKLVECAGKRKDKILEHNLTKAKISQNGKIEHLPKYMPVKDVKPFEIKTVPHVLATLSCNQSFSRHTCVEIKEKDQLGAYWAIKCLLRNQPRISIPNLSDFTPKKFLSLLGQYELETLLFLVLHNKGLFVPSWRGGTLKDVDIIAQNKTDKPIKVGDIEFETLESKTFQVKRGKVRKPINADYTVALSSQTENNKEKIRDAKWLLERVEEQYETKQWLRDLLDWVNNVNDFLKLPAGE